MNNHTLNSTSNMWLNIVFSNITRIQINKTNNLLQNQLILLQQNTTKIKQDLLQCNNTYHTLLSNYTKINICNTNLQTNYYSTLQQWHHRIN